MLIVAILASFVPADERRSPDPRPWSLFPPDPDADATGPGTGSRAVSGRSESGGSNPDLAPETDGSNPSNPPHSADTDSSAPRQPPPSNETEDDPQSVPPGNPMPPDEPAEKGGASLWLRLRLQVEAAMDA